MNNVILMKECHVTTTSLNSWTCCQFGTSLYYNWYRNNFQYILSLYLKLWIFLWLHRVKLVAPSWRLLTAAIEHINDTVAYVCQSVCDIWLSSCAVYSTRENALKSDRIYTSFTMLLIYAVTALINHWITAHIRLTQYSDTEQKTCV